MSELTLLILRLAFLVLMWGFIFAVVYALRSDLFGPRVAARKIEQTPSSPFPSSPLSAAPTSPVTPPTPTPVPQASPASPGAFTEVISPAKPGSSRPGTAKPAPVPARRLVITKGPKEGLEIELPGDQLTIGRSSESGLVIRDDYTSTHHARLMLWNEAWMVQDLDSTNGTFLDGARVTVPTPVPLNTPITIGTTSFELRR